GLAGHYTEESLRGKQVVLVVNLEPVRLMGIESKGMLLAAEDGSGLHLVVPDSTSIPGSKVN
ncbi:MAG TPA: methionine--tRNA ligase subunit beta, partial [Acidobacteriota bacterium]|nr:methionine--tRNA ligase subunit beta [Acidobacteriota bacterium]